MPRDVARGPRHAASERGRRPLTRQEPDQRWIQRALGTGGVVAWEFWIDQQETRWYGDPERLHGLPDGGVVPTDLDGYLELVHPEDREMLMRRLREAVAGADRYEVGYRVRPHDGDVRWLRLHGTVIREGDGTVQRLVGTLVEETTEREAERRLARTALRRGFLADVSQYLAGVTSEPEELIDGITHRVAAFLGATCLIRLIGDEAGRLGALVIHGDRPDLFEEAQRLVSRIDVDSALVDSLGEEPRTLRSPSPDGTVLRDVVDPRYRELVDGFAPGPAAVVPLVSEGRLFGILMVVRHESREPFGGAP